MLESMMATFGRWCNGKSEKLILEAIQTAIEDGESIGIVREQDIIRLAGLALLPRDFLCDPLISSVLIRTLNRTEVDATVRLDFIYEHIVVRLPESRA